MVNSRVAIVLPPREVFAANGAGAISLLVHRLAVSSTDYDCLVLGRPIVGEPLSAAHFVPVRSAWFGASAARRYAGGVARVIAASAPSLIEVHNRPDVALFLASRFPGTKASLFLHNDPQGMRRAGSAAERAALLARLASVVAVSPWVAGRLRDGIARPAADPVVLPNCLDLAALPAGPPEREQTILFAGRVVRDKGADSFVQACARALPDLPGWRAAMIGGDRFGADSPDTPFLRALRPDAARAGVAMQGWRPYPEVMDAMARAAIVVVPSRWPEPFGLTALEAMASGAALVCSDRGGLASVVGDAACIIDPDDPAAIAACLIALARDPARRAALSDAGRRRARRFDVTFIAAELDGLRSALLDVG